MKSGCRKEKSKTPLNSADCPQDRGSFGLLPGHALQPRVYTFLQSPAGLMARPLASIPAAASAISLRSLPLRIRRAGAEGAGATRGGLGGWAPGP